MTVRAILACVLLLFGCIAAEEARVGTLLLTGTHNHDWRHTSAELATFLEASGRFKVEVSTDPEARLQAENAWDGIALVVLDLNGARWSAATEARFLAALSRGVGLVVIHAANNAFAGWQEYEQLIGLDWGDSSGHGEFHRFDVDIADPDHPITHGLAPLVAHPDELYHRLVPATDDGARVLMTAYSAAERGGTGRVEPMVVVREAREGHGRMFHTTLGHVWPGVEATRASLADPALRCLIARGAEWAATGRCTRAPESFGVESLPVTPANTLTPEEVAAGWTLLFDGKTTRGWRGFRQPSFPDAGWSVVDGSLRHERGGGGGDIVTLETYTDFEFTAEWRVEAGGNSGIFYRVSEAENATWSTGPEMQVLDDARHADGRSPLTSAGALYGLIAPRRAVTRPAGTWNQVRILVDDGRIEHWMNGELLLEAGLEPPELAALIARSKFSAMPGFARQPSGVIALQDHGDRVDYRSIKLRKR